MSVERDQLLGILRIGHDVSMRGQGLSLRDAIQRSDYRLLRGKFGSADLLPLLKADPDLVEQWLMYSEDKRATGGFWVLRDPIAVGCLADPDSTLRFQTIEEAVAEFVVREIDFWFELGRDRRAH